MATAALSVTALRRLNMYDCTDNFPRNTSLEDMVIEHLTIVKELQRLDGIEEFIVRMTVEGYKDGEIALALGCSVKSVRRWRAGVRATLKFSS